MYLFLDETKYLNKKGGKFILSGLVTKLRPGTIDQLYKKFLEHTGIKEKGGEIKSYDKKNRDKLDKFYYYIKSSKYGDQIEFVGIFANNYKESGENYYTILECLLIHTLKFNKIDFNGFAKISIIADSLKLDFSEEKIKNLLNNNVNIRGIKNTKGFSFVFENSKKYGGLKFADFISGTLRKIYILKKDNFDFIKEYFVNNEIVFVKLK